MSEKDVPMEKIFKTRDQKKTELLGKVLGKLLIPGDFVALSGQLGAGKTAFARGVARGLDISEDITSPTFTIINQYKGLHLLAHIDAYRLGSFEELETIGFYDYLEKYIILLEWPEIVEPIIPEDALWIYIKPMDDGTRKIKFVSNTQRFDKILQELDKKC